jgi:hypothetical protein
MDRTRLLALMLLVQTVVLSACEQTAPIYTPAAAIAGAESATFVADNLTYAAGAPVTLRLTNTTPRAVSYNLCRSSLERHTEDDWVVVRPLAPACTAELRTLLPGQAATFTFPTDRQDRNGDYRVRSELYDPATRTSAIILTRNFRLNREDSD